MKALESPKRPKGTPKSSPLKKRDKDTPSKREQEIALEEDRLRYPWLQRRGEGKEAYASFLQYLQLDPGQRSLALVEQRRDELGMKRPRHAGQWVPGQFGGKVTQQGDDASRDHNSPNGDDGAISTNATQLTGRRSNSVMSAIWSSRWDWIERARAYDNHQEITAREIESELIRRDVVKAMDRRRTLRERHWRECMAMLDHIDRAIHATGSDGQPVRIPPKDLRELAIARERIALVAEKAFADLPVDAVDGQGESMTAEMAVQFHAIAVMQAQGVIKGSAPLNQR